MDEFSILGNIASLLGFVFAAMAFFKARTIQKELEQERVRQKKKVRVILQLGSKPIKLPVPIRRSELTRAEILGRIGMVTGGKRFDIKYLNSKEFFTQIEQIAESDKDGLLTIPLDEGEFQHFKT
ncbi:MAG: hypothetical protein VST69_00715 [Nitrospirota bacterium]|nr:hypothetical protein [Nitrospirota bacterium]